MINADIRNQTSYSRHSHLQWMCFLHLLIAPPRKSDSTWGWIATINYFRCQPLDRDSGFLNCKKPLITASWNDLQQGAESEQSMVSLPRSIHLLQHAGDLHIERGEKDFSRAWLRTCGFTFGVRHRFEFCGKSRSKFECGAYPRQWLSVKYESSMLYPS